MILDLGDSYHADILQYYLPLAKAAGFYEQLFELEGIILARNFIECLSVGLYYMKKHPIVYSGVYSIGGWNTRIKFIDIIEKLLEECIKNPNAKVSISK